MDYLTQPNEFIARLNDLMIDIHTNARAKGFYENPPTFLERVALMHEELGEASSWFRHSNPPSDHIPKFTGIEEELADCVIRILDCAAYLNLNIGPAIIAKHEYNKTRPYKHGKTC